MTGRGALGWTTTVSDLMGLLRRAFVALVPVMDAARVPWRDGEAYDQWDEVASVLFDKLVCDPLTWALGDADALRLGPYDMAVQDYRLASFIAVRAEVLPAGVIAAVSRLTTLDEPFDSVAVVLLDDSLAVTGHAVVAMAGCTFYVSWYRVESARRDAVEVVVVPS